MEGVVGSLRVSGRKDILFGVENAALDRCFVGCREKLWNKSGEAGGVRGRRELGGGQKRETGSPGISQQVGGC